MHGAGFTAGSLARKGARGGTKGTGKKVSSDKESTEIGRMVVGDRGGQGKGYEWRDQIRGCGDFL